MENLVLFDLDGTLIDSIGDLADAMNAVLRRLGHPQHPRDSYRYLVGDGIEILVRRALPPEAVDQTDVPAVVQLMRQEYSTRWTATTRPFPEIPKLLSELNRRGIRSAVLSNKPDSPTRVIVGELFPDDPFAIVRGALEDVPLKPDPTSALEIVSGLGAQPETSIFVGDTSVDMKTGRGAGMRTVGVTWGFRGAEELIDAGAEHIIEAPLQLLEILEPWARVRIAENSTTGGRAMSESTRRDFIKTSSAVVAGAAALPLGAVNAKKQRVALVGTGVRGLGMWGQELLAEEGHQVEMVGLCDINPLRLEVARKHMKSAAGVELPTYTDFDRMVRETKPEQIIVTTVDSVHHTHIVRAMELGCDVITEKPMTTDPAKMQRRSSRRRRGPGGRSP